MFADPCDTSVYKVCKIMDEYLAQGYFNMWMILFLFIPIL